MFLGRSMPRHRARVVVRRWERTGCGFAIETPEPQGRAPTAVAGTVGVGLFCGSLTFFFKFAAPAVFVRRFLSHEPLLRERPRGNVRAKLLAEAEFSAFEA